MSSVAGECGVVGWLVHKVCWSRLRVFFWSGSSSLFARWFVSSGSYSYPCMRPQSQQQFDQCDQCGRGSPNPDGRYGRAQSKPTHTKSVRSRLDTGQRPRSKMFLFPFKRVLLSVPLEQLNDQTESFRFAAPGAHSPQIDGQLASYSHDGFFARRSGGNRTSAVRTAFGQDLPPFAYWFVIGLEADQSPSQLHQGSAQARVAMLGHAALQPRITTGVFAGAKTGVAGYLTAIVKAVPIADLSIDDHAGHSAQTARLVGSGRALQLQRESRDLFLEREQDRLAVSKQLSHPLRYRERGKSARLPPVLHRLQAVIDHQTAALSFQSLARAHQLLALPMNGPRAFLFFRWHAHDRQRVAIALYETVQLQTERLGIQPVSLHPLVALIQLLRTDHVAMNPQGSKLPLQRKTKPARFIHRVHFGASLLQLGRPVQEGLLVEPLRRLGIGPAHLLDHHIKILMHINSHLDRASAAIKLAAGFLV